MSISFRSSISGCKEEKEKKKEPINSPFPFAFVFVFLEVFGGNKPPLTYFLCFSIKEKKIMLNTPGDDAATYNVFD